MDASTARDLALAIPGTVEADHFGNSSYRAMGAPNANGKAKPGVIFMTVQLEANTAVLMLNVEQQTEACAHHPAVFEPLPNKWGEKGATRVLLQAATPKVLTPWLTVAWRNAQR